jgi:hypothetical protein
MLRNSDVNWFELVLTVFCCFFAIFCQRLNFAGFFLLRFHIKWPNMNYRFLALILWTVDSLSRAEKQLKNNWF